MSYFIFNGKNSRDYGTLAGVPIFPRSELGYTTQEIPGRAEPLIKPTTQYKTVTLALTLGITDPLKAREINQTFCGSGKLILSTDLTKYYRAYAYPTTSPERVSRRFGRITINFICMPFAYAVTETPVTFTDLIKYGNSEETRHATVTVTNNGSVYCEPLYKIKFNGKLTINVGGAETVIESPGYYSTAQVAVADKLFVYETETLEIYIDAYARIAYKYESGVRKVLCNFTSGQYPLLDVGDNVIKLSVAPRTETWEHDVEVDGDTVTRTFCYRDQSVNELTITKNERWL